MRVLNKENEDMKKLYGERPTPSRQRAEKTKVISHSGRSRALTKEVETEEEESPSNSENTSCMGGG